MSSVKKEPQLNQQEKPATIEVFIFDLILMKKAEYQSIS